MDIDLLYVYAYGELCQLSSAQFILNPLWVKIYNKHTSPRQRERGGAPAPHHAPMHVKNPKVTRL